LASEGQERVKLAGVVVSSLRPGTRASNSSIVAEQLSSLVIRASNQPTKKYKKIKIKIKEEETGSKTERRKEFFMDLKLYRCTRGWIHVF
jgi:hypothetical protein